MTVRSFERPIAQFVAPRFPEKCEPIVDRVTILRWHVFYASQTKILERPTKDELRFF